MHSESTRGTHDAPAVLEAKLTLHSVRQSGLLSYQPLMPLMLMQRLLLRPCASCETVCVYVLGITMTITGIRVSSDNHHQRLGPSPTTLCYFHHPTRHLSLSVRVCSESGRGHQERRALVSRALKDQVPQWCVAMSLSAHLPKCAAVIKDMRAAVLGVVVMWDTTNNNRTEQTQLHSRDSV